jgi:hypothetical protein
MSASSDVDASEYDLGTTSVRLIRVGNIIQVVFSSKLEAKFYYDEASARFKRAADRFGVR